MPVDTHVHLASSDRRTYPFADVPPISSPRYENTVEQFIASMDEARVQAAIAVQPFALYGYDNSYLLDSTARFPGRLTAVVGLSTRVPEVRSLFRRLVSERGAGGLRVNMWTADTSFDHPQFMPLMTEAADSGVPVCFLISERHLPQLMNLALCLPDLQLLCDHLGGLNGDPKKTLEALLPLAGAPNVFIKFSAAQFIDSDTHVAIFPQIVAYFGVERLMWGTNYPATNTGGYTSVVDIVRTRLASYSAADRRALFQGTALRLWPQLRAACRATSYGSDSW